MRILIVTPAPPGSLTGNRVTAQRWSELLQGLGHETRVLQELGEERGGLLIALHAYKSLASISKFREARPGAPLIVALTGTDLYRDLQERSEARQALDVATRLVALHPRAAQELPEHLRSRVHVILQSLLPVDPRPSPAIDRFEVCVIGHLRPEKDPFRTAQAARRLPAQSRIVVVHAGAALSPEMERQARAEEVESSRYRWLGAIPRSAALSLLARCRMMVLSSRMEGGANVLGEAVVNGVPVLASRIAGSTGLLGDDYPGLFEVGDTEALTGLLRRSETDETFYEELRRRCCALQTDFHPDAEREAWRTLLQTL